VPIYKKGDKKSPVDIKNMKIFTEVPLPMSIPYADKILRITSVDFNIIHKPPTRHVK